MEKTRCMPMPSSGELNRIAQKILDGNATPEEKRLFDEWYNEDVTGKTEWKNASSEEALRQRMFARIRGEISTEAPVISMHNRAALLRRITAAAIVIIIATAIFLYTGKQSPKVADRSVATVVSPAQSQVSYTRFITLPDGSTVLLHANSTLEYPESFEGNKREVTLTGEAFFDIQPDPSAPFLIRTGKVVTTVLGTAFNIRAYPANNDITVAVKRGKVKVEEGNKLLAVLLPDELVTYNTVTNNAIKQKSGIAGVADEWVRKEMSFDGKSFVFIAAELSKRYDVKISFNNPALEKCTLKAFFTGTEPIEKVMKILCTISNAAYTWESETHIVLDGAGCP